MSETPTVPDIAALHDPPRLVLVDDTTKLEPAPAESEPVEQPPRRKRKRRKRRGKPKSKPKPKPKPKRGKGADDLAVAAEIIATAADDIRPIAFRPGQGYYIFRKRGWTYDTGKHDVRKYVAEALSPAAFNARVNAIMGMLPSTCKVAESAWLGDGIHAVGMPDGSLLQVQNRALVTVPREKAWQRYVLGGLTAPPAPHCIQFSQLVSALITESGEHDYFQQLIGAALLGYCGYGGRHEILVLHGPGGTGKTTLVEILAAAAGSMLWKPVETRAFMVRGGNTATASSVATLVGARIVSMGEPRRNDIWDTGIAKQFTGGDSMHVDRKGQDHMDVQFRALMIMMANHVPRFRDGESEGMTRRLNFLRTRREKPAREDTGLPARFRGPLRGQVIRWILDGCEMAAEAGGAPDRTPAMLRRTRKAVESGDSIAGFIGDKVRRLPPKKYGGTHVSCRVMHGALQTWWADNEDDKSRPPGFKEFNRLMVDLGFDKARLRIDGAPQLGFRHCKLVDDDDVDDIAVGETVE